MPQAPPGKSRTMAALSGYRVGELLRRTATTEVYEAVREHDHLEVVAKLYSVLPDETAEARLEHELRLLRELDVAGTARVLELVRCGEQQVLVFERGPGIELKQLVADRTPELPTFLTLAVRISRILAEVHARRVVHRALRPTSILVDPRTLGVCLTDFDVSVAPGRAQRRICDPENLADTLPYLSPEQAGRTARSPDHRSDLYSLGAILYELLAGRPPFEEDDPMALVHAHLARQPEPLDALSLAVPEVIRRIVERLLAKDPADRYQSAQGLLHDLERCAESRVGDTVEPFEIALEDLPETLRFPSRLYGREPELRQLHTAFERAARGGVGIVMIRGAPGIGKTALVGAVQRRLAALGGYFVSGKFERQRRNTPLLALRQALATLAELLLMEDQERLSRWKARIAGRVGSLGGVLSELVPKLGRLLGPQAPPIELGSRESSRRLQVAVGRLLTAVASVKHPLVVFLDDLQWSDPGSLQVIEHLLFEHEAQGLLLIGAYRDVGDDAGPPLSTWLDRLAAKDTGTLISLALDPLSLDDVTELVGDILRVDVERARRLARILESRSDNNPLLVRQLLLFLAEEGLLRRGAAHGWTWSDRAVRNAGIPEGAAGVLEAKVARLPRELRQVLVAASCVGSRFDVPSLAAALRVRPVDLLPPLATLCDEGLLAASGIGYRFAHDRIEEAARKGLDGELERGYHERVGRFRRQATADDELPDRVFEIVDHLNRGVTIASSETDPALLLDLVRLDHLAGVKAIHAASYRAAERYLAIGIEALGRAPAESRELDLALRLDHARSLALSGCHEEASRLFDELIGRVPEALSVGRICLARVETSAVAGERAAAVRWGLYGLACCGLSVPRNPSKLRVILLMLRLKWACRPRAWNRVLQLPPCTEPLARMRLDLLAQVANSAFQLGGLLFPAVAAHTVLELIRHGRSDSASFALATVGVVLGAKLGDRATAERLALAALASSRIEGTKDACQALVTSQVVLSWMRPYRHCLAELEPAFALGIEQGDVEFAAGALSLVAFLGLASGLRLVEVEGSAERSVLYSDKVGMAPLARRQEQLSRLCEVLSGRREIEPEGRTHWTPCRLRKLWGGASRSCGPCSCS